MDYHSLTLGAGREIAKVLDERGVKPPLTPAEWDKIHAAIDDALIEWGSFVGGVVAESGER